MIFFLYNVLLVLLLPLVTLFVIVRWRKRVWHRGLEHWGERWGHLSKAQKQLFGMGHRWWWVHAVSLGEVKAIERFLKRAPHHAGVRIVLSVVTPEALSWAREHHLADEIIAAPFDLPKVVRRVFHTIRPEWFMTVESEFWPNLLREAHRSGARVALINGRISERSFRRYRWIRFLLSLLWENIDLFVVREAQDARRFGALGVPAGRLHTAGHMKYDVPLTPLDLVRFTTATATPVLVLGSTRAGEEEVLAPVIERVRAALPSLRVIWAPRHIERVAELQKWFLARSWPVERRTEQGGQPPLPMNLLWDTFGNLTDAYTLADVAVIGGSYVQQGGQNPIEPAALGTAVVFGPSMENFKEIARGLKDAGGAVQSSLDDLPDLLIRLLTNPEERRSMVQKSHDLLERASGATDRTLELLERPR